MGTVVWIISGLLALAFSMAGLMKLTKSKAGLVAMGDKMAWAEDFGDGTVKLIGLAELLGGIGIVVPALTGIAPILSPIAAVGLVWTMAGAALTHVRRSEMPAIVPNVVLGGLAAFVAASGLIGF
jgi:uncharacterized membrane protein YphA (DoxX/SURF4 family)